MKPFSKAIMLTISLLMLVVNGAMLFKLVERLKAYNAQQYAEEQNLYAPSQPLAQTLPTPTVTAPVINRSKDGANSRAKMIASCLIEASHYYKIPPAAMIGILHVEGGRIGRESGPNSDGSYDLGPMQINTQWLPELARAWGVSVRKARAVLRDDGCMNVKVAAWILHKNISEAGSVYTGIAHYHSVTPELGKPYAAKVMAAVEQKGLRID